MGQEALSDGMREMKEKIIAIRNALENHLQEWPLEIVGIIIAFTFPRKQKLSDFAMG